VTPDGLLFQACRMLVGEHEIGQVKEVCMAVARREQSPAGSGSGAPSASAAPGASAAPAPAGSADPE
jgi:hypothetical protein